MGKLTIQEIAKILVEKNKLTPKEANQFAATMFEIIQQQLDSEEMVKIKGLGTFKTIRVESRESVSVRTGERVMIGSHTKVTFTPDATMKELVNKPFSQFETVVLNDGVEFDDLSDNLSEEEMAEVEAMEEETSMVQPLMDIVDDDTKPEEEEKAQPEVDEVQPEVEEEVQEEVKEEVDDEEEETHSWKKPVCYGLLTLVLMAASAYGGYWYGQKTATPAPVVPPVVDAPVAAVDSVEVIEEDTLKAEVPQEVKNVPEKEPVAEVKKEPEEEPFWKKYEAMDVRVRTGAYHIIGTDHEVKVRAGETLSRIARRELGEGMACYIEVYNDLKSNSKLQEGQIIKIPKLKWKKKRKE